MRTQKLQGKGYLRAADYFNVDLNTSAIDDLSDVLKASQIGFWSSNPLTDETYINEAFAKDWGFTHLSNPIPTDTLINAVHPEDRDARWRAVEQSVMHDLPYHAQYRVIRPDGSIIWVEARGECLKNSLGYPYRFAGTATNITEKVISHQNLLQELEEQKKIVAQLKLAQESAEHANKNKSVFLANVSHEIRTPLTAILGFTDLLKSGPISENEKNQFIETITRNGNTLIKIIDDVLDLSKVEANCLELEKIEFSVQQLLHNVINQFKEKAKCKNLYLLLDIQTELPPVISSDSIRFQQIINNLLSNALKFTDQGGVMVQVKSNIKKQTQAEIEIKVIDTGIGLTEDQKNRIFQPFIQAENSTTRKFGGTGLGLALSKRLAEALDGELSIERYEKDGGCTFKLTLSVEIPASETPKLVKSCKQKTQQMDFMPLSGYTILLAEDSLDNQFFIEKFLMRNGAKVELATNGYEVLEKCKDQQFDALLMDIDMPEMDGYQATRSLRANGYKKPILALTAHAMAEERAKTREAGCDGHLTKPIDTHQLLTALEGCLKTSSKKKRPVKKNH